MADSTPDDKAPPKDTGDLEKADLDTVYAKLKSSAKGLTSADAKARIEQYGRNELVDKEASDPGGSFCAFSGGRSPG